MTPHSVKIEEITIFCIIPFEICSFLHGNQHMIHANHSFKTQSLIDDDEFSYDLDDINITSAWYQHISEDAKSSLFKHLCRFQYFRSASLAIK